MELASLSVVELTTTKEKNDPAVLFQPGRFCSALPRPAVQAHQHSGHRHQQANQRHRQRDHAATACASAHALASSADSQLRDPAGLDVLPRLATHLQSPPATLSDRQGPAHHAVDQPAWAVHLERRWIGQYGAGRVRHRRSLPRQHCVRIAGRQGVCNGTAAGKQGIQQRTELAEDRVDDIHSRGRVRPGRGGNGHWIIDKQRLLRSRPSDPAAKPNCANCGQRERQTQRRSGQWPASIRNRKHVPGQGDNSSNSAEAPSASDTQVTPVTMLVKNHN